MATSSTGGYECEFMESVSKDFECPLCLHVTREPHQTNCCGQDFCQGCINRVLTDNKPCPFCKSQSFNVFFDKKEKRKILELKVYCTVKDRGCSWTGELRELNSHLDTTNGNCQYVDVPCTNNCGETLQRRLLPKHLTKVCPKRDFTCEFCRYKATFEDVSNKHMPVCTKYPLPCPNDCGIGMVERGSLEKHVSECPLQLVQCEFSHLGCSEEIERKDVEKHMTESTQTHLVMMSATFRQVNKRATEEIAEMKRKLSESEKENEEIRIKLAEKNQQIELLQTRLSNVEMAMFPPPVEFTVQNYSQYKGKGRWWKHCPSFYSHPMGAKIMINLYMSIGKTLLFQLQQVPGEFDRVINWPVRCTVTVQILNQKGDTNHLQHSKDIELIKTANIRKDIAAIPYSTVCSTQRHVLYVKDDCLCIHTRTNVKLN